MKIKNRPAICRMVRRSFDSQFVMLTISNILEIQDISLSVCYFICESDG